VIVVGVDPGPTRSAWSAIESRCAGRWQFVRCGMAESNAEAFRDVLALTVGCDFAFETPSGYIHEHARGAALLATARVAGELVAVAQSCHRRVVEMSASKWRQGLTGKSNASDALIKKAVELYVDGLPKRSNAHVRDAIGVAIVGASMHAANEALAEAKRRYAHV
jgi:Holliday junction resolvasome RuvABC endonuclease subunit